MATSFELSTVGTHTLSSVKGSTVIVSGKEHTDGAPANATRGQILVQGLSLSVNSDQDLVLNLDNSGYAGYVALKDISASTFNQGSPDGYSFSLPNASESFCAGVYEVTSVDGTAATNTFLMVVAAKMWEEPGQDSATISVKDFVIQKNFSGSSAKVYFYFEDGDPTPSKVATGEYTGGD
ncbi:MAG: hypothetical protein AAFQ98_06565 [Bacteroidota bacterium]